MMNHKSGSLWMGDPKRFKLGHANYGKEHVPLKEYSLFVGDLTPEVDDLLLYSAFSPRYPSVKAAKVVLDQNSISKGYGFVRFTNEAEYQAALVEMQNAPIVGSKPIRVSVATPKRNFSSTSANQQDYQGYYQYPSCYDYQNYYAAWQGYQQQYYGYSYDQAYPGYESYQAEYQQHQPQQPYHHHHQAPPPPPPQPQPQPAQAQQQHAGQYYDALYDPSYNYIEEHDTVLDVDILNEELMDKNEELYDALDSSRWLPTEDLDPPLLLVK